MRATQRFTTTSRFLPLILLSMGPSMLLSCNRPNPVPPPKVDRLAACAPKSSADDKVRLALVDIEAGKDETRIRIVAYAGAEVGIFPLPVYYLSRGRWLIGEDQRSYLLDEQCRQYNLHDRHDAKWTAETPEGKITLKPGTAFETVLDFPPRPPNTTRGVLVYGSYVIPFSTPAREEGL